MTRGEYCMVYMNACTHLLPSGIFPYTWHTLYIHIFFFSVSESEESEEEGGYGKYKNDDKKSTKMET